MIRSRGKIKRELITESFVSLTSGKKDILTSFGGAACSLCLSTPHTCILRENGDMAACKQTYRCPVYQWSWLAASQLWPWRCEKAFAWPVPMLMSPAESGVLTSRVEQGWVRTSRNPGSYFACLHHLGRCIHLYLLCTHLISQWK